MTSNQSTTESFTNSSVEYFLLDPSPAQNGGALPRIEDATGEILSPILGRGESAVLDGSSRQRLYFDDDTLPSTNRRPSVDILPTTSTARSHSYRSSHSRRHAELSGLNYLNVLTYIVHVFVWWGISVWGLDGMIYTRWEMTEKYETLVTPVDWAFNYLWIPILILQGCFTITQMLPYYRARPIISTGTRYFFFYTVLLQVAYTLLYSFRLFIFSFVAVALALISLLSLLFSQQSHGSLSSQHGRRSWMEYFMFRLPFLLHLGWMILMAVHHFSLLFRRYSGDVSLQLASDIVALGVLLPVATYALYHEAGPDWVIPIVILWYYVRCRQMSLHTRL